MPFAQFLQQRIFEPLGMVDTDFWVSSEKLDRFAAVYSLDELGGLKVLDTPDICLLYTSPSPRDRTRSRMPSSA